MSDHPGQGDAAGDHQIPVEDLVAYAEGRLPPGLGRREAIEAHLAEDPRAAARVRAYQRQDHAIRDTWGSLVEERIPPRLQPARLDAQRRGDGRHARPVALAATIVLAAAVGFLLGRAGDPATVATDDPSARVIRQLDWPAAASRAPADGPRERIATLASGEAPAPDLSALGMRLTDQNAADPELQEFRYQGPRGEPIHLFRSRTASADPGALRTLEGAGFNLVYWQQDGRAYALAGPLAMAQLEALAFRSMARVAAGDGLAPPADAPEQAPPAEQEPSIPRIPIEPLQQPEAGLEPIAPAGEPIAGLPGANPNHGL